MERAVYMDYNATAPMRPAAAAAMGRALELCGNPSSVHRFGRLARRRIEEAREAVAALAGARPEQVVFTSGGTEANNLALTGAGRDRRLVSAVEHDSVLRAAAPDAEIVPVDANGVVDLPALADALARDPRPALVSIMLANNETGVLQPVATAAEIARARGALLHCDAIQAAGKVPLDFAALGVDLLSLSAHKLGGPQGCGALIVGEGVKLAPLLRGGGQERYRRAGTENTAAIAGFGAAAAAADGPAEGQAVARLRDRLESGARAACPGLRIFGAEVARLPNTACFAWTGLPSETQVVALDLAGIAVSAGSACSSGKVRPSHVLRAMGASHEEAGSAIRVSLGWGSTEADVERFLDAWGRLVSRRSAGPARRVAAGSTA